MRVRPILATVAALALSTSALFADTYKADTAHSVAAFKIQHDGVADVYGLITGISGSVSLDGDSGSVDITAKVDTLTTGVAARDKHLKSEDFFAVAQFPTITFKSTKFAKTGDGTYDVTGSLTLHGVTKEVTVKATVTAEGKGMKGEVVRGFNTTFTVKRSDYGIEKFIPVVGDEVTLMVSIEGSK